jgi:hypothetical protein
MFFDTFIYIYLFPSYDNIIIYLSLFQLRPPFKEQY